MRRAGGLGSFLHNQQGWDCPVQRGGKERRPEIRSDTENGDQVLPLLAGHCHPSSKLVKDDPIVPKVWEPCAAGDEGRMDPAFQWVTSPFCLVLPGRAGLRLPPALIAAEAPSGVRRAGDASSIPSDRPFLLQRL